MTVVLWDIDVNKRRQNDNLGDADATNWSLQDYTNIAQRCIGAHAVGSLAKNMLRNEDAISFVAESLMIASFRWNPERGRTLNSYLNQCAIWSIQRWIMLSRRANRKAMASLDASKYHTTDETPPLYAVVADDNTQTPDDILSGLETTDGLHTLIEDAGLTERQLHCLEVVYIQGERPADVARDLGISRQAVDQCIHKGIHKIRMAMNGTYKETLCA